MGRGLLSATVARCSMKPKLKTSRRLRELDRVTHVDDLSVPTLILHGSRNDSVPIGVSLALAEQRADLVQMETLRHGTRWRGTLIRGAGGCVSLRGTQNSLLAETGIRHATPVYTRKNPTHSG